MAHIRPISDLWNSIDTCENKLFESDIYFKLIEAESEAKSTNKRYSHEEVFSDLRARLTDNVDNA